MFLFALYSSCIIFDYIIVIRSTSPNQHLCTLLVDSLRRKAAGWNGAAVEKAKKHRANGSRSGVPVSNNVLALSLDRSPSIKCCCQNISTPHSLCTPPTHFLYQSSRRHCHRTACISSQPFCRRLCYTLGGPALCASALSDTSLDGTGIKAQFPLYLASYFFWFQLADTPI